MIAHVTNGHRRVLDSYNWSHPVAKGEISYEELQRDRMGCVDGSQIAEKKAAYRLKELQRKKSFASGREELERAA